MTVEVVAIESNQSGNVLNIAPAVVDVALIKAHVPEAEYMGYEQAKELAYWRDAEQAHQLGKDERARLA